MYFKLKIYKVLIKQMMKKDVQSQNWKMELIWNKISSDSVGKILYKKQNL